MSDSSSGGGIDCDLTVMSDPIPTMEHMVESHHPLMTIEKPEDHDPALVPNDITNETSSNCTDSAEDTLVLEHEKDDDFVDFPQSPRIQLASPPTSPSPSTNNPRRFSADAAAQAQLHALTRETYSMSLRQLRQERLSWRRDKLELDHLRSLLAGGRTSTSVGGGGSGSGDGNGSGGACNPLSINSQIQSLFQEKVHHEELLEACNDEIETLKEQLHTLQTEHKDLKKDLIQTQQELQEERSRQEEEEQQQQQQPVPDDNNVHQPRISMSSINHASTTRRINDLEEQIHKWEVLYFESAEMGERQIHRLEEEVEQLREELEQIREEQAHANNSNEADAQLDEELQEWKNRVQEMEEQMRRQQEELELQIKAAQGQEENWESQVLSLSKLLLPDDAEPETFADRLAALAEEMNKAESSNPKNTPSHSKRPLPAGPSASPEMTPTVKEEEPADVVNQTISSPLEQEPETQIPLIVQDEEEEKDSYEDVSSSTTDDGPMEQYVADLEKQIESNVAENVKLKEVLNQERVVAKNREDGLRKQLMETKDLIVLATNREAILNKELTELNDKMALTEKKHATVVEDLQAQLQRAQDELGKSQQLVKEWKQKAELSRQAQILLSESATTEPSSKSSEWEKERLNLQRQIESQQKQLDDAKRRIDATQRENSQLRDVKDSLMGIDREMEELIESLEPLQNELAEQTRQAKEARDEAAFLQQELVREMARRPEFEREIKALKDEIARTKGQLNKVYIDLKNDQAAHEAEVDEMKETLEYYKSSLEILQEAMHEVNEDIRNSSSLGMETVDKLLQALESENKILRADKNELKKEVLAVQKSMEADSKGMQNELKTLRQKVADLESEMDALELEASMAIQARDAMEEALQSLQESTKNSHGKDQLAVSDHITTTLGNLHEIDELLQEIEEVRQQATQKQDATELRIRKLEAELQIERKNASLVVELKKQIKSLEAERANATPKESDQWAKTKKPNILEDRQATAVISKDLDTGHKDAKRAVLQQNSESPSTQRLSVKDIVRSKENTEQNTPTIPKQPSYDHEDQQTADVSSTERSHIGSEQQNILVETAKSPLPQQTSEPSSKQRLSVKEIVRSKQWNEQNTIPKAASHDLDDQQTTVMASKDTSRTNSEQENVPVETAKSRLQQQTSKPSSQQRLRVKDIVRSNTPLVPTTATHNLEPQASVMASKDLSCIDSEQQKIPVETAKSSLQLQESESPSKPRLSVKDIVRSKESNEQNTETVPKTSTHDPEDQQAPVLASKDVSCNDLEQHSIAVETTKSSMRQRKSKPSSKQGLSVKDIVRSQESTVQNTQTVPKTATHDPEDQQAPVLAAKDVSCTDSEEQIIPVETTKSSLRQRKSKPSSKQRLSVKDIVRSQESTEQNKSSTVPKAVIHDPEDQQAPVLATKDVSCNDSEQQTIPVETTKSSLRQQKSKPSKHRASVKEILRSTESAGQITSTVPKAATHDLEDQQAPVLTSKHMSCKDSEQQTILETKDSSLRQQKPKPSKHRASVKEILRSKESTGQNSSTVPKAVTHDLDDQEAPVLASKDFGIPRKDSEHHSTAGESEEPSVRELESDLPSKQRLSVKDIIRSKESTEQNMSPLPTLRKEQPQRPSISVKDMLQNFQK